MKIKSHGILNSNPCCLDWQSSEGVSLSFAFTISVSPNNTGTENNCLSTCLFISSNASLLDSFLNTMNVLMNAKGTRKKYSHVKNFTLFAAIL